MKKIISAILACATIATAALIPTSAAGTDGCLAFNDIRNGQIKYEGEADSGSAGYMQNVEDYTLGEYTISMDFKALNYAKCVDGVKNYPTRSHASQFMFMTANAMEYLYTYNIAYDFEEEAFIVSWVSTWPMYGIDKNDPEVYVEMAHTDYKLDPGEWYDLDFKIHMNAVEIYVNDELVLETGELDHENIKGEVEVMIHDWLIMFPQHCHFLIDNLSIGSIDYNASEGTGECYDMQTFNDLTGTPINITETDEDGNETVVGTVMKNGENVLGYDCGPWGPSFSGGAYTVADKATTIDNLGWDKPDENAIGTFAFSDAAGRKSSDISMELSYTPNGDASLISATKLSLVTDAEFTYKNVSEIAAGCTVTVKDGKVDITMPEGFSGKLAKFTFTASKYIQNNDTARATLANLGDAILTDANSTSGVYALYTGGALACTNYVFGDVNMDGKVNIKDVTLLMQYLAKWFKDIPEDELIEKKSLNLEAANVYYDQRVNTRDVTLILQHLAKWNVHFGAQG